MFLAMDGIAATMVDQPAAAQLMNPAGMASFDALVLYDMPGLDFTAQHAPPSYVVPDPGLVSGFRAGSRKEALAAVRIPTLVIHGDADPLLPFACGIDTAESVRGSKLVILNGMGHALPISLWPQIIDAIAAHSV